MMVVPLAPPAPVTEMGIEKLFTAPESTTTTSTLYVPTDAYEWEFTDCCSLVEPSPKSTEISALSGSVFVNVTVNGCPTPTDMPLKVSTWLPSSR